MLTFIHNSEGEKNLSVLGAVDVDQWCSPGLHKTLGSVSSRYKSTVAGADLQPQPWEVEAEGSESQGHFYLFSKFEANLGYPRSCFKTHETLTTTTSRFIKY